MPLHRLFIFAGVASVLLALAACGSSGEKKSAADSRREIAARAEAGNAEEQYLLGMEICCGGGDVRGRNDLALATQWFCRAARQGEPRAQYRLGLIYGGPLVAETIGGRLLGRIGGGNGLQPKPALAAMWLDLAMAAGHEDASARRIALGKRMTPADHLAAEKLRARWREEPCDLQSVYGSGPRS